MKTNSYRHKGAVACGHPEVAKAATLILEAGGNAFDAIIAAQFSACVVEPVLTSLGGGGYLLACPVGTEPRMFDFFVQTPRCKRAQDVDFYPIDADFGGVTQEFHIGLGSAATPGTVLGAFTVHESLGSLPIEEILAPAIEQARNGVVTTEMQAYIFSVVSPIYCATAEAKRAFFAANGELPRQGDVFRRPVLADTLSALASEGAALFYRGEIGAAIAEVSREGGHLTREDLEHYQVVVRKPLSFNYRGASVLTNPPPSFGGILIAFALTLLADIEPEKFGSIEHLSILNKVMSLTRKARLDKAASGELNDSLLDPDYLSRYRDEVLAHPATSRGTTHISVVDRQGNMASMSLSNGEGCGAMVPGTGFMLNNMLGEEDINPDGFGLWPVNQRMASMMAPTVVSWENQRVALGTGGSNRIRSAIMQVVSNLVDFDMSIQEAIESPRIHHENDELDVEAGFNNNVVDQLETQVNRLKRWQDRSLFFGGVHAVQTVDDQFFATGDSRRGGVGLII